MLPNAQLKKQTTQKIIEQIKSKGKPPVTESGQSVAKLLSNWSEKRAEKKRLRRATRLRHESELDRQLTENLIKYPFISNPPLIFLAKANEAKILTRAFEESEAFRHSEEGSKMITFLNENRSNQNIKYAWETTFYKEIKDLYDKVKNLTGNASAEELVTRREFLSKVEKYLRLDVTKESITAMYESAKARSEFMAEVRKKINPKVSQEAFDSAFWNLYRSAESRLKTSYDSSNLIKEMTGLSWGDIQSGYDSEFIEKFSKQLELKSSREQAAMDISKPSTRPSFLEKSSRRSEFLKEHGDTPISKIAGITDDEYQELTGLLVRNTDDRINIVMSLKPLGIVSPNDFKPLIKVVKKANALDGAPVENSIDNYVTIANLLKEHKSQNEIAHILAGVKYVPTRSGMSETDSFLEAYDFATKSGLI